MPSDSAGEGTRSAEPCERNLIAGVVKDKMTAAAVPREERFLRGNVGDETCRAARNKPTLGTSGKKVSADEPCLNTAALSQLVGAAKTTAMARHLHPELLEGLDLALATIDPSKVTTQLILKAFEHVPGASAQLQQILGGNSETAASLLATSLQPQLDCILEGNGTSVKGSFAPGDYLVLQTPVIQATVTADKKVMPKAAALPQPSSRSSCLSRTAPGSLAAEVDTSSADCKAATPEVESKDKPNPWKVEQSVLVAEVQALRKHKEWADHKIDQLIRRVRDAEGPHRLLKTEVQQLRLEKDSVESKLKEFEQSLQKLKDCTYSEAAQRREFELSLRKVQAELRGASLREQEVQGQMRDAQATLRQEKKRREAAERQLKKVVEERSDAQATAGEASASAASLAMTVEGTQQAFQGKLLELQAAQDEMHATQQKAAAAEQRAEDLQRQLANAAMSSAARHGELEGVIAALTAQLDEAQVAAGAQAQQSSLYSHFGGPALFQGGANWLQNGGLAGLPVMDPFTVDLNRLTSSGYPAAIGNGARGQPADRPATPASALHPPQDGVEVP